MKNTEEPVYKLLVNYMNKAEVIEAIRLMIAAIDRNYAMIKNSIGIYGLFKLFVHYTYRIWVYSAIFLFYLYDYLNYFQ